MTVTINISGLDPISDAINNLARAMGASGVKTSYKEAEQKTLHAAEPAPQIAATVPASRPASAPVPQPAPAPVPVQTPQATAVQQPVPQPVPTTTATYTLDDLGRAGMTLMDSGRQGDLLNLLTQFGVTTLPELQPAQYGAFATALRGMGAQI